MCARSYNRDYFVRSCKRDFTLFAKNDSGTYTLTRTCVKVIDRRRVVSIIVARYLYKRNCQSDIREKRERGIDSPNYFFASKSMQLDNCHRDSLERRAITSVSKNSLEKPTCHLSCRLGDAPFYQIIEVINFTRTRCIHPTCV